MGHSASGNRLAQIERCPLLTFWPTPLAAAQFDATRTGRAPLVEQVLHLLELRPMESVHLELQPLFRQLPPAGPADANTILLRI